LLYGDTATLERADEMDKAERHQEALRLLETALAGEAGAARAEVLWRLSRVSMKLGDDAERSGARGAEILPIFERGEQYGQLAMDADPRDFHGYFWKSGNAGRWGQTKGVLQALSKAGEMRKLLTTAAGLAPGDKGSYYVLGQLYREVPGPPLSFGNTDTSVNLGRKALDMMEVEIRSGKEDKPDFDYYTELGKSLHKRNWSTQRRARAVAENRPRYQGARDELTRAQYYESTLTIPAISDREEARTLVSRALAGLEAIQGRSLAEGDDLKEAREVLAGFR
jgi:hypothetical protein